MPSTESNETERIQHLQWRLKRLENFIGTSSKFEKKRPNEVLRDLNETVLRHSMNNNHGKNLMNRAEEIQHLTSSVFQRRLLTDRATKLEMILADEQRIREITENLGQIESLARVLDEKTFQEVPKLSSNLNQLLTKHQQIKSQYGEFTETLTEFLQNYASFTLMMDENLQQYKKVLVKMDQASREVQDRPVD